MKIDGKTRFKMVALVGLVLLFMTPVALVAQQKVSDVRVVVRDVRQERDSIRVVLDIEAIGACRARVRVFLREGAKAFSREDKLQCDGTSRRLDEGCECCHGTGTAQLQW